MALYDALKKEVTETKPQVQQDAESIVASFIYLNDRMTATSQALEPISRRSGWTAMLASLSPEHAAGLMAEIPILRFAWCAANVAQADMTEFGTDLFTLLAKWEVKTASVPFPVIYDEAQPAEEPVIEPAPEGEGQ